MKWIIQKKWEKLLSQILKSKSHATAPPILLLQISFYAVFVNDIIILNDWKLFVVSKSRKYQTMNEIIRGFANSVKFFLVCFQWNYRNTQWRTILYTRYLNFVTLQQGFMMNSFWPMLNVVFFYFHLALLLVSLFERHVFAILLLFFSVCFISEN